MKHSALFLIIACIALARLVEAQTTVAINQLFPNDMLDERSSLVKSVMGIESSVSVSLIGGIKYVDACNNKTDFGQLKIEIQWYNVNNETGKFTLQLLKDMNGINSEKENFLKRDFDGKTMDFASGTLKIASINKSCVNELTGPTGTMEYSTEALFFSFNNNKIIKIALNDKIKPETAQMIILKIVENVEKFDFSVYGNTIE